MSMDALTAFGQFAVTAMLGLLRIGGSKPLVCARIRYGVCARATASALGSACSFLQGAWPFGVIEAIWALCSRATLAKSWNASSTSLMVMQGQAMRSAAPVPDLLDFVAISMGPRRVSALQFMYGWRGLHADEAKRRVAQARLTTPPRASSALPKPVRQVKATVERLLTVRWVPSLPTMPWHDDRR
jgi:hypothetical protein